MNLRINLHATILGDQFIGNGHPLQDRNALLHNGIMFHITHTEHTIDLGDAQPMQDIRHQRLKAHILHPRDILRALEILARAIGAAFPRVVHEILGHFPQGAAFLAEIDDDAGATGLGFFDRFLNAEDEVGAAGADVGAEDVGAVAFVVDAEGEAHARVRHLGWVAKAVDGEAADGREE